MTLAWCLTPVTKPNQHLHGPFPTRERAQREAVRLLSHEAKLAASQALRMPPMLVPTPCSTLCRQPTAYQPQAAQRVSLHSPPPQASPSPQAMAIYRLTEGKLRYMAAQLGIELPSNATTRASIIEILTKELDLL